MAQSADLRGERRRAEDSPHRDRSVPGETLADPLELMTAELARLRGEVAGLRERFQAAWPRESTPAPGALEPVFAEVALAVQPLAAECGAEIVIDVDPAARSACFDRARLSRVLAELLDNALRHSPEGGSVEIASRGLRSDGCPQVEVAVLDEGPGVAADERLRVFEAGADDRGQRGLVRCRRWVEGQGGTIALGERPEGGARVAFTLPGAEC